MGTADGTVIGLTKVYDEGPSTSRWNLVLVSEGYTSAEMPLFHQRVQEFIEFLFTEAPFNEPAVACAINIYRLDVTSTESGADDPNCNDGGGNATTAATYFDATYCADGEIHRLLSGDDGLVQATVAAALPNYHSILVLVNTATHGGASGAVPWFAANSGSWREVALHELGHNAFNLADEYDYYSTAGEDGHDHYTDGEPDQPNVSIEPDPASVKWSALVTAGPDVPTMANADCGNPNTAPSPVAAGIIGTFTGARYFHCDIFRPAYLCRMRDNSQPFCAVCQNEIRTFYAAFAAPTTNTDVSLDTPTLDFGDTPVGTYMLRAAVFSVESCVPITFEVTAHPADPFSVQGAALVVSLPQGGPSRKARIFFKYRADTVGVSSDDTATVRCVETNESWVIPLLGDCVARPSVAVQLVLDRSGSMLDPVPVWGDKGALLRFSASVLIDLLYADSGIGVNEFDQDPHPRMDVTVAGDAGIGLGRLNAWLAIGSYAPNPAGATAIGDGIELGRTRLDAAVGYDAKAMIVLTDGKETAAKYVADVAADVVDQSVYAIGLGTASSIQPATLDRLVNDTGGYLLMTGAPTEESAFLLAKYYLQILAGVTNNDIVLDPDGVIVPGQVVRIPFDLTDEDVEVTAAVVTPQPRALKIALEAPNGDVFSEADAPLTPTMRYSLGRGSVHIRANLPLEKGGRPSHGGRWHLLMVLDRKDHKHHNALYSAAMNVGAPRLRYTASVYAWSNVKLRARMTQSSLEPGATLILSATLTQGSLPFEARASVKAEFTLPDGTVSTVSLARVEAGRYQWTTVATAPGVYRARVMASGWTDREQRFTREQTVTAAVWRGGDTQPERPETPHGDPTRDPLRELLCCLLRSGAIGPEAMERLKEAGIDPARLKRCLGVYCKGCDC